MCLAPLVLALRQGIVGTFALSHLSAGHSLRAPHAHQSGLPLLSVAWYCHAFAHLALRPSARVRLPLLPAAMYCLVRALPWQLLYDVDIPSRDLVLRPSVRLVLIYQSPPLQLLYSHYAITGISRSLARLRCHWYEARSSTRSSRDLIFLLSGYRQ